jgi:pyruvate-formate lyase-activating enzyme
MDSAVIFYGAGAYAGRCLERWLAAGLAPVCFADRDRDKQHTTLGGLEILSLDEAMARHSNYILYVTCAPANLDPVCRDLLQEGVPKEKIRFADAYEYRLGCELTGKIFIEGNELRLCRSNVNRNNNPFIVSYDDLESGIQRVREIRGGLSAAYKRGVAGSCEGCNRLIEKVWPAANNMEKEIMFFLNTGFAGDCCNLDCVYCDYRSRVKHGFSNVKLMDTLRQLFAIYGETSPLQLTLSCGEFFMRPDADDVLVYLAGRNCRIVMVTNGTIYNENFALLGRKGKTASLNVSLDCGTRETYIRVKGRDLFDKVLGNLERYSRSSIRLIAKYVFKAGLNDGDADILNFIEIASRLNAKVQLAADFRGVHFPLPATSLDSLFSFYDMAVNRDLSVSFFKSTFHEEDFRKIISSNRKCSV